MNVTIRTDSSQKIGSGHVIRCLALAEGLRDVGLNVEFITRIHKGNIDEQINSKGFKVNSLLSPVEIKSKYQLTGYERFLGVRQEEDANETIKILASRKTDWLIIDHYALDYNWEERLKPYTGNIMVIDDLANRKHECDLLLDQNYTHDKKRYDHLLSLDSIKLLGPKYALLRKDFVTNKKIHKHQYSSIKKVFVFFGGSDLDNLTTIAIKALSQSKLKHLSVDVVIGLSNPHQLELKAEIDKHPNAKLHIQTDNMAELMAKADIALGAGGSTTWERMAVGLPSIVITLAENQVYSTRCLDQDGYLQWIGNVDKVHEETIFNVLLKTIQRPKQLQSQIQRGQELVDGMGTVSVTSFLLKSNK